MRNCLPSQRSQAAICVRSQVRGSGGTIIGALLPSAESASASADALETTASSSPSSGSECMMLSVWQAALLRRLHSSQTDAGVKRCGCCGISSVGVDVLLLCVELLVVMQITGERTDGIDSRALSADGMDIALTER